MKQGLNRVFPVLLLSVLLFTRLAAQDLSWDPALHSLVFKPDLPRLSGGYSLNNELSYSIAVTGYASVNETQDRSAWQLAFFQTLKYKFTFSSRRFHLSNDLTHDLGLLYYIDSISKFQTDENTLTTRFSYDASGFLQFMASSILKTRIFNAWDIATAQDGSMVRTLSSSFLTPLICTFSCGFGFIFPKTGILDIGVSSARLTYIYDQGIFEKTGLDQFYGVARGKRSSFDYGLSLHLLISKALGSRLQWNCDLLLVKAANTSPDLSLKNLFAFRINGFLKTSLQTKLFYDEDVSRQLKIENLLSIGFDFHL